MKDGDNIALNIPLGLMDIVQCPHLEVKLNTTVGVWLCQSSGKLGSSYTLSLSSGKAQNARFWWMG